MKIKEKCWSWILTYPFAHENYTTVGHTIYFPEGSPPSEDVIRHEEVHERQWMEVGFLKFYFLYLFCLPVLWNPWRKKWELEAYTEGSKLSEKDAKRILASYRYGWLR